MHQPELCTSVDKPPIDRGFLAAFPAFSADEERTPYHFWGFNRYSLLSFYFQ
jgi:hypothetical protein